MNSLTKYGLATTATGLVAYLGYKRYGSSQPLKNPHWSTDATGDKFHGAILVAKTHNVAQEKLQGVFFTKQSRQHGAFVHVYSTKEYEKMKLFLLDNGPQKGVAGVAVKENGEIVSIFKHPDLDIKLIVAKWILPKAIANGGTHLDCFNGFLPKTYATSGFRPVARVPFNPEFAPEDWNYERDGKPDIIFMVLDSESSPEELAATIATSLGQLALSESYEKAQEIQKANLR